MRFLIAIALVAAGCGKEIGDACIVSSDCSQLGDRQCDPLAKEGYCTIQGCDYNTCPQEAVCVRFYTGSFQNRPCTQATASSLCSLDELCTLAGHCAPRSSELRYCMRKCNTDSDCRDGYECRTFDLMKRDGGEPLLTPGVPVDENAPGFCAAAPVAPPAP